MLLALCLNGGMRAADHRMAHFRDLIEGLAREERGPDSKRYRAAYKAVQEATGLKEEYVYQLFKGKKTKVGDEAASKLERAFGAGRPPGWMDAPLAAGTRAEADFEPLQPPSVSEAVDKLAEVLLALNDDGRAMASTALSNLARNPERASKAAETLLMLASIHPREPDPTKPTESVAEGAAPLPARAKTKLTVRAGGGQKMQLDLPLKTVSDPFDKASAPTREREWYARLPKAKGRT